MGGKSITQSIYKQVLNFMNVYIYNMFDTFSNVRIVLHIRATHDYIHGKNAFVHLGSSVVVDSCF